MAQFTKGQSGNPKGRPKGSPNRIRKLARQNTVDAVLTLVAIMNDAEEPGRTRIAAAEALLDRGYGRPAQTIEAQDSKGNAVTLGVVIVPQKAAPVVDAEPLPVAPDVSEPEPVKH